MLFRALKTQFPFNLADNIIVGKQILEMLAANKISKVTGHWQMDTEEHEEAFWVVQKFKLNLHPRKVFFCCWWESNYRKGACNIWDQFRRWLARIIFTHHDGSELKFNIKPSVISTFLVTENLRSMVNIELELIFNTLQGLAMSSDAVSILKSFQSTMMYHSSSHSLSFMFKDWKY